MFTAIEQFRCDEARIVAYIHPDDKKLLRAFAHMLTVIAARNVAKLEQLDKMREPNAIVIRIQATGLLTGMTIVTWEDRKVG